jgi:hypothetical protein
MKIYLQPETWCELLGIHILDPDGWDRKNFAEDWAKPLLFADFADKCNHSTTDGRSLREPIENFEGRALAALIRRIQQT